jgi:hypothetical protein
VPAGLGEVGVIKAKSRIYILLHGAFMIGAWICAASLGIIMARSGTIQRRQLKTVFTILFCFYAVSLI